MSFTTRLGRLASVAVVGAALAAVIREIARYLAAVDVFRAERCEPTSRPENRSSDSWTGNAPRRRLEMRRP